MESERYAIDPVLSRFTVRAFAAGMLSALGHNPTIAIRDFSGHAEFVPTTMEEGKLHLQVNAGSLEITDQINDKDRREMERTMNQEVLETNRFPEIVFDTSKVSANRAGEGYYFVNMIGNLSLHGVTNNQPVAAQVTVNGDLLNARGEFTVKQTAYGIKPVSVAGGTLKLKDELKFSFDIVARKQSNHT